jgi:hypothetical protein
MGRSMDGWSELRLMGWPVLLAAFALGNDSGDRPARPRGPKDNAGNGGHWRRKQLGQGLHGGREDRQ